MKPFWVASILLIGATLCHPQVSTQYLDFGPLGLVSLAAQDTSGNVYVVGVLDGYTGIRVYKISPSGTTLYRFDFGSGKGDYPTAAAVDGSGALYIAGNTYAPGSFPVVHSLFSYTPSAESGFVSKIDPSGSQLVFSTLLGGKAKSVINAPTRTAVGGLALDAAGNVYATGWTEADDFPITAGAYQTAGPTGAYMLGNAPAVVRSAFVTKIAASVDRIVYSTFLSGHKYDSPFSTSYLGSMANFIGVDANGLATVAGSNEDGGAGNPSHFPVTPGAYGYGTSACCAFVTRLSADGGSLVWSALGVSGTAMDASGSVLSTGQADTALFQTTSGALQTTAPPNNIAGVVQKLSPDGSKLLASTFLGTATIQGLTFDSQGNIWVAGSCGSSGLLDFPSTPQPASAFFAEISPNLDHLIQSHLMPGYQDISVRPSADGSVVLVGNRGGFWLLPAGFASQSAVLDVSNSAASVYWAYVGDGTTVVPVVTGSANWQYVSPGAFVSIYGSNLGPAPGVTAVYDSPGHIATSLGGVAVSFDGIPASLLYAGPGQINAIVPFEVAGQSSTVMRVQTPGGFSQSVTLPVIAATPFVFHTSQFEVNPVYPNPGGPFASALNQDGSVNSASNPAKAGSVITIFANGAGLYTQPLSDGTVNGSDLISPALAVGVYDARHHSNQPVFYAGTAPGLAAGVLQVNFQLDSSTIGVDQYILIVGNYYSQPVDIYTAQ
jgi:uncharacterized protein (TIGR03437 family)